MGRFSFATKWTLLGKPSHLLLFICVLLSAQNDDVCAFDSDKFALLEFKASLSDPYDLLSSWSLQNNPNHCSWFGVSCDSGSRVVSLIIAGGGNALSCARISRFPLYVFGIRRRPCLRRVRRVKILGRLSAAVARLSELRILSLPFNELSGEIPFEIWGMEKLEVLDLEGNLVSGSLPAQFSGLKILKILNLGFNEISGEIPGSLSESVGLQVLNLAGNQINGSIPGFMGKFTDLRGLYLSYNLLGGFIPDEIGDNCGKLEHLDLSGNYLAGSIPKSIGNCKGLKSLILYSNILEEVIPDELGQLSQLEILDVSRNNFGGPIPPQLGNCTKLSVLVLSNLWDPIPDISSLGVGYSEEKRLYFADEYNFYEGTIPLEITRLSRLRMVWGPRATLEGSLYSWGSCESLEVLNLAQNYYSGKVLDSLTNCTKLWFLDLSYNRLSGEVVDNNIPVPCMTLFDISGNYFSGNIPTFSNKPCYPIRHMNRKFSYASTYVSYFSYKTLIENSLPFYDKNDGRFMIIHNFGSNNFTGPVFSTPVASEILGKHSVYAFLAGGNKLTGSLTGAFFDKCDQAGSIILNVTNNMLTGQIPADIASTCKNLIVLDLSGNRLSGSLPPSTGDLVSLLVLNLSRNLLSGPIPNSLAGMKDLKSLSLAGNNLDGPIPASLGQLYSLEVLDLSSNSLSGEIPENLTNLRKLKVFLLNNNKLTGRLPLELPNVPTLLIFNASFNYLSGTPPINNTMIKCNSFIGNPSFHCPVLSNSPSFTYQPSQTVNLPNGNLSSSSNATQRKNHDELKAVEIASITSSAIIVSILVALIVLFFYTQQLKPRSRVSTAIRKDLIVFTDIGVPLTFEKVVQSTGNFNASNCIGSGGFGATYKAEIAPGVLVAIKRLSIGRFQLGVQQFDAEVKTLGRLRHPNLVTLIGYHASENEMFLIYNYLPGGNLERFIQERSTRPVDWRVLHKIALNIANALAYLHHRCVPRVLHRDVKPSNILLDEGYNAYLSDFGLARLLGNSETHATTGVAGTFGYVAPEYAMTCRVSDKADVYSYGVVLLELFSDKKLLDPSFSSYGNGFNIVAWGCMLLREGRAKEFFASGLWDVGPHDDLIEVLHLAVVCTVESLSTRPTMKQVVKRLKQLQPPPC